MSGIWRKISDRRERFFKTEDDYRRYLGMSKEEYHHVQDDTMPATWHPATGEYVESKSKFRRMTKNAGCIEFGNDLESEMARARKSRSEIDFDKAAVAKEIYNYMSEKRIDHKQLARDCDETFRRLRNGERFEG